MVTEQEKLPLAETVLVNTGVQFILGSNKLVEFKILNVAPGGRLVPLNPRPPAEPPPLLDKPALTIGGTAA